MSITINKTYKVNFIQRYELGFKSHKTEVTTDNDYTPEDLLEIFKDLFKESLDINNGDYWDILDKLLELNIIDKGQITSWYADNYPSEDYDY